MPPNRVVPIENAAGGSFSTRLDQWWIAPGGI